MGAASSSIHELPENEYLKKLSGREAISENDPFWNQLLSFSFTIPTNSAELKLLDEASVSVCKSLVENNPRTGNLASLIKVFLSRTKELKISAECQNHLFIWQAQNALFIICCLLKVLISQTSEEELQLHFTYEEKTPGSCGSEYEDLMEELLCCLIQLIVEVPLLDITYSISLEAVTTLVVFLSCQLFHKEILRKSFIHKYLMHGRCLSYTSRLVKTLLYNFIRQERSPPPTSHVFQPESEGGGLLYGIASGVATLILKNITWYSERVLTEISLGSLLILVVIRTIQYNMTRTRDKYLHTNCLAALANMSAQFRSLHQYAAQRIISYTCRHLRRYVYVLDKLYFPRQSHCSALEHCFSSLSDNGEELLSLTCSHILRSYAASLFSLLSKKHNKVLEQATQSLRSSLSAADSPLPDYAQDLNVIEEVIRMMLEIINSCLTNSLHHNPNLVYALLYKRDLFEQFRTHPSFQDIMQNIDLVISFFSSRIEHPGAALSVERVLEIIKQGAVALPKDRLRKFPELKFKYVEEEQPEEFFIPYVWSLVYNSAVALYWNSQDIQLFTRDSG
ncbi:dymeclin [Erythrolamprus reginae]|uniref:dymeclin n=1 Tax=Erythrolamprus reginae TaxID=121349 RepID=UPI00396CCFE0